MRIGILTFTNGTNIGQRLQNYALQETLKHYADEVYTIRQSEPYSAYKRLKISIKKTFISLMNCKKTVDEKKREQLFKKFNEKYINFYGEKLKFQGDNAWISKDFDAFVVGSDQVWNPKSPDVGDNFFLEFAKPEQRYTYAPSFSVKELPENVILLYKKRLKGFKDISVREEQGSEIVHAITGCHGTVVLDPTLLIDRTRWDQLREPFMEIGEKNYALCVFLGTTDTEELKNIIKEDLVVIRDTTPISPTQFLDLIARASVVLTDSYHVTIFSIIYHIPFINFKRMGTNIDMNSRFETLYKKLGIENRSWDYLQNNMDEIYRIDFNKIEMALKEEKAKSLAFLDRTIGKKMRDK